MKFIIKSEPTLLAELNAHFQANPELYARFGLPENGVITALPANVKDSRFHDIFLAMYGGKLVLLEGDVQACQHTFQIKYSAGGANPAFYENLNFPWTAFSETAVEGMDPATFILGFIHRFDAGSGRWWLSSERFSYPGYSGAPTYPIFSTNTLFDLPADGNVAPYDGGLSQDPSCLYDPSYFSNVKFDGAPINKNSYVNRLCYAWTEISQLFSENKANILNPEDSLFSINFCSISSDYSAEIPASSLVPFPHTLVMYMSYDGQPLLTDGSVVAGSMFVNHAADSGTLCPPQCSLYTWPVGLQPVL